MNCRELRDKYDFLLDTMPPHILTNDMSEHVDSCNGCRTYVQAMADIDAGLRNLPDVEVPADLEKKLLTIPSLYAEQVYRHTKRERIWHAVVCVFFMALIAFVALSLVPKYQLIIQTAILASAFVLIAIQHLRRSFNTVRTNIP